MDIVQIGNVTLPAVQPAAAIALFGSWLYARMKLGKSFSEHISNAFFLFIAVWKVSVVLFQLELVIEAPLSLLYFNGGTKGFVLGLAAALAYMWRKKMSTHKSLLVWAVVMILYPLALAFLSSEWTYWHAVQAAGSLLFFFVVKEGIERALVLLLFWQLLFFSAEDQLISVTALAYIIVTAYLIVWRKKT